MRFFRVLVLLMLISYPDVSRASERLRDPWEILRGGQERIQQVEQQNDHGKPTWLRKTTISLSDTTGKLASEYKSEQPNARNEVAGGATFSFYFDSRAFSTLAIGVTANKLPLGLQLWGFTDLHGPQNEADHGSDVTRSFSEYRLSHDGIGRLLNVSGFALQVEYNDFTPGRNAIVRFGLTYKHSLPIPGWLQWRVFPVETDGNGGQLSLIYNFILHDRLRITGFADYNVANGGAKTWVIEPQLIVSLSPPIWGLLEFRYNGFESAAPELRGSGMAGGIQLKF